MPTTTHRDQRRDEQAAAPTSSAGVRRARTFTAGRNQRRFATAVLVVAVLLAVVVAVVLSAPPAPVNVPTAAPRAGAGASAVDEDEALRRLIARGYVPAVTAETNPVTMRGDLYTPEEAATLRLVRAGLLPDELLEAELFVTKRLINRGLVPAGSAR